MRGTLDLLHMHSVPVGIGTDGGSRQHSDTFTESSQQYIPEKHSSRAHTLQGGRHLLREQYELASDKSLTLLCISSMKDAALFLRDNEKLFVKKTLSVVVMGGVKSPTPTVDEKEGKSGDGGGEGKDAAATPTQVTTSLMPAAAAAPEYLVPDTAHNNMFDKTASDYLYRRCQELGVPIIVVSRFAAYDSPVSRSTYDDLARYGGAVGWRLRNVQRTTIINLWKRACAPADDPLRRGLPPRCDQSWFTDTFCGGNGKDRGGNDPIWDVIQSFNMYDTVALLAAVPSLRARFFTPSLSVDIPLTNGSGDVATHTVFGMSREMSGVREPAEMQDFLHAGYHKGAKSHLGTVPELALVIEFRDPSDKLHLLLMSFFARALLEMNMISLHAVVILYDETTIEPDIKRELMEQTRAQFQSIGLEYAPLYFSGNRESQVETLLEMYTNAPETGIVLVNMATATVPAEFLRTHWEMFQRKTQCLLCIGKINNRPSTRRDVGLKRGSFRILGDTETIYLTPNVDADPNYDNNAVDPDATIYLYQRAQELGVNMTVVEHDVADYSRLPKSLFDRMGSTCGEYGKQLLQSVKRNLDRMWTRAMAAEDDGDEQHSPRVDASGRELFVGKYGFHSEDVKILRAKSRDGGGSEGPLNSSDDVWEALVSIKVDGALLVLAAVPELRVSHLNDYCLVHQFRGIEHLVISTHENAKGMEDEGIMELVKFLSQLMYKGARLNVSDFSVVPDMALGNGTSVAFDLEDKLFNFEGSEEEADEDEEEDGDDHGGPGVANILVDGLLSPSTVGDQLREA
jgi:hypothetical protein